MNEFDETHKNFDKWYERIIKLYDESLDDETYYKIQTALTQAAEIERGDKVVVDRDVVKEALSWITVKDIKEAYEWGYRLSCESEKMGEGYNAKMFSRLYLLAAEILDGITASEGKNE